jgi:hypothetical protein
MGAISFAHPNVSSCANQTVCVLPIGTVASELVPNRRGVSAHKSDGLFGTNVQCSNISFQVNCEPRPTSIVTGVSSPWAGTKRRSNVAGGRTSWACHGRSFRDSARVVDGFRSREIRTRVQRDAADEGARHRGSAPGARWLAPDPRDSGVADAVCFATIRLRTFHSRRKAVATPPNSTMRAIAGRAG